MKKDIQSLVDDYHKWLSRKTVIKPFEEWSELTTPYLDRDNDYIQIYAKHNETGWLLTDDGSTISGLEISGFEINSDKRKELLKTTLNGFGVRRNGESIEVSATDDNFSLRKHNLIQAMLAVNDMFFMATPHTTNVFIDDVASWMEDHEIRAVQNNIVKGAAGLDHRFDFIIAGFKSKPARYVQAINRPDRNALTKLTFSWIDTEANRPRNSMAYAFINDADRSVPPEVTSTLMEYKIRPVLWSEREGIIAELAA